MKIKILEVRDRATFIPVMAVEIKPENYPQQKLIRVAGYGMDLRYIMLTRLDGASCSYDPFNWNDRTMQESHLNIIKDWDNLVDGSVIDVEFILGETTVKKQPQ